MIAAICLFLIGVFLSAFFSGAETGFYRATRLRLVIDALGGDWIAKGLLQLVNRPALFVATLLVGNNLANYLVSRAVVEGVRVVVTSGETLAELVAPLVIAPFIFVYGESMPKAVSYDHPNRFLRACGPALIVCTYLFLPLTVLLGLLGRGLEMLVGQSPQKLRLALARRELEQVLEEGHRVGILHPVQRSLAQGLFAVANRFVVEFATPVSKTAAATTEMDKREILALARNQHEELLPLVEGNQVEQPLGYLRAIDLILDETDRVPAPRPLVRLASTDSHLESLLRLQQSDELLACVTNAEGRVIGYVTVRQLVQALFKD